LTIIELIYDFQALPHGVGNGYFLPHPTVCCRACPSWHYLKFTFS